MQRNSCDFSGRFIVFLRYSCVTFVKDVCLGFCMFCVYLQFFTDTFFRLTLPIPGKWSRLRNIIICGQRVTHEHMFEAKYSCNLHIPYPSRTRARVDSFRTYSVVVKISMSTPEFWPCSLFLKTPRGLTWKHLKVYNYYNLCHDFSGRAISFWYKNPLCKNH